MSRRLALSVGLALALLLVAGCGAREVEAVPDQYRMNLPRQFQSPAPRRYAAPSAKAGAPVRAVASARAQVGKLYRFGGASPARGFDCSGLIWWAYKTHGVFLPRVTRQQARAGVGVARAQARPGDILVFRTGRGGSGLHTALYVGKSVFVHSPRSGKRVRYDSLRNTYWSPRLVAVRRVAR